MLGKYLLIAATLLGAASCATQLPPPSDAALTGTVSSAEEGAMEGVLVSAKLAGSTVTITVALTFFVSFTTTG